jgi:3-dehydroquinate synthase
MMSGIEREIQVGFKLRVYFTQSVFHLGNSLLKEVLVNNEPGDPKKALMVLDESLAVAQPGLMRSIEEYFAAFASELKLVCPPLVLEGGERAKNS